MERFSFTEVEYDFNNTVSMLREIEHVKYLHYKTFLLESSYM